MIHLEFHNHHVKVVGADSIQTKLMSDMLSFEPDGAEHVKRHIPVYIAKKWDGRKRLMDKRKNTFPSGLADKVVRWFREEAVPFKVVDCRKKPASTSQLEIVQDITYRDYQLEAAEKTDRFSRGIFVMGTGAGKTMTAGKIIQKKSLETLFVTPDAGLREQTYNVFSWMFGEENVSKDITSGKPIVVSNIQGLVRKEVRELEKFKMLMIDEFHHAASNQYTDLSMMLAQGYYRYGLTGTFVRPDGRDMVMHGVLAKVIYKKTASELIEDGWLVPPEITVYEYKLRGYSKLNYRQAYDRIVTDHEFNSFVAEISNKKISENKQTIILVRRKEHGEILASMIPRAVYISGDDKLSYRDQMKRDFNAKKIPALIATSVMGEGQDIPNIDVLVNARLQESEIQTKQGIGRALRLAEGAKDYKESVALGKEKCEVYDFKITGQRHLKAHSESRIEQYSSEPAFRISICRT